MTGTPAIQKRFDTWIILHDEAAKFDGEFDFRELAEHWLARYKAAGANSLETAGQAFDLDPENDADRALLLRILADIAFGVRKLGRPKGTDRWNSASLFMLGFHEYQLKRKNPDLTDSKVSKLIKAAHASSYRDTTAEAIRTELPRARRNFESIRRGGEPEL
jgi:hypothetical protein